MADEPDLFAEQEPTVAAPAPEVPRCPDCRLAMDKAHTKERCADWSLWRKEYRNQFDAMDWGTSSVAAPLPESSPQSAPPQPRAS